MNCRLAVPIALSVIALSAAPFIARAQSKPSTPAAPSTAPAVLGAKGSAKWTETTVKAAGTPEQKAVLDGAKAATIMGELVEVSCYLQLGKRGEKHIPCGSDCLRHGMPAGIVDKDGKLTLLFVEEHDPRRNGQLDVREKLADLIAKQVTATGMLTMKDGFQALYVAGSDILVTK